MPQPPRTYSKTEDLLLGDIPLPARHGDGSAAIVSAAEDIDAQIGHFYVTPISVSSDPKFRPTKLILKKINNYIASGRLILDMAAAGEDAELHAYGMSLLNEGKMLLARIVDGSMLLDGVDRIDSDEPRPAKLYILNEDDESLVEGFYRRTAGKGQLIFEGMQPYGQEDAV